MSRERDRFDEIGKKIKRETADGTINSSAVSFAAAGGGRSISSSNSRQMMISGGAQLNTITPCAACKLLRRRCAQECPFSPYFSPHEPQKFASVHKVFGASNVSKMLLEVPETQRADAANSLVYEANVRLRDPVYGCMGAILALQQQVQALQADLNAVSAEIIKYKYTRETTAAPVASPVNTNNNNLILSPSHLHQQQQLNHNQINIHSLPHHQMGHLLSQTIVSVAVPPPSSATSMPPAPPSPPTAPPLPAQPQQPRLQHGGPSASSIYSGQSSTDQDYGAGTVSDDHDHHNNNVNFFG